MTTAFLVFATGLLFAAGAIVAAAVAMHAPGLLALTYRAAKRALAPLPRNRFRRGGYNLARTLLRTGALERVK